MALSLPAPSREGSHPRTVLGQPGLACKGQEGPRMWCLDRRRQGSERQAGGTCVNPVVGLQLVLEAELLAAAIALVRLLTGVDALVAFQRALVSEAAAAEFALVGVVACKDTSAG